MTVACCFSSTSAVAWWSQGHAYLTASAIKHLAKPLRAFFAEHDTYLIDRSADEPGGSHWIHMDKYPSFFEGTFPRKLDDAVAMYGLSFVRDQGTAPWRVVDYVDQLASQMANSPSVGWQAIASTAADLAHYVQDLHNPFHLTQNYNGQNTGNVGIHARYEGQLIVRHLDDIPISTSTAEFIPSVLDYVFDGIDAHYPYLEEILAADDLSTGMPTEAYYESMWEETGSFTQHLFQQASEAVANVWHTAWVQAGSPTEFLPVTADFNGDGVVDLADYTVWRDQLGMSGVDLLADADGNGLVDEGDYTWWKAQFGRTVDLSSTVRSAAVPESSGLLTLGLAALSFWGIRKRVPLAACPSI